MIYYNLQSPFEGDITKHCGLTIDEVDNNFFELEEKCYNLMTKYNDLKGVVDNMVEKIEEIEHRSMVLSCTMHDTQICPPGTSNQAYYTFVGGKHYNVVVTGKINYYNDFVYDNFSDGNYLGIAIMPLYGKQEIMFPSAKWFINDEEIGRDYWQSVLDTTPQNAETALYVYPKVEKIDDAIFVSLNGKINQEEPNTLKITIQWDENNIETYSYMISQDVELEQVFSETFHDNDNPCTNISNNTTYEINADNDHEMNISGIVEYDVDKSGNYFSVGIRALSGVSVSEFPDATYSICGISQGSLWTAIEEGCNNDALYLYPKVEKLYQGKVVVSLNDISNCSKILDIDIHWNDEVTETYHYIVSDDITLETEI